MSIKKNFLAPLALGLGATRRAAMLLLVMMLTTATAWAQIESGSCGDNLTWRLTARTLTIRGTGAMYDYNHNMKPAPWNDYADQIHEVVIEDGVTSIGAFAFYGCTGLASIDIPASVTSIGERAFYGTDLTSVEIPASVTSIGEYAFSECTNLGSVTFAEGSRLKSIGDYAFQLCSNLTSITIPASVTSIGEDVFQNCDLASITVEDRNTVYDSRNGCNAIIVKSTNTLIIGCKNSTIPASVTSIGAWAFYTTDLTSIEIPASVTSIGMRAFQNCLYLTSITIPAGVTSIGDYAFGYCLNLATVTVYAPSCSLGEDAFANCDELANIYVFSDKVASYQAAWSAYAGNITALPTVTTSYVDASGTLHEGVEAIPLNNAMTTLPSGTYVVNSDVAYTGTVTLSGDVTLILADGKTMSIGTEDSYIHDSSGIVPTDWRTIKSDLCIYGQTAGTGSMEVFSDYGISYINSYTQHGGNVKSITYATSSAFNINYYPANDNSTCNFTLNGGTVVASAGSQGVEAANNIIINGGTLDATAQGNNVTIVALKANNNIIINGGQVTATSNGNSNGIYAKNGTILDGGSVTASSYEGTVIVANGWTYAADEDDITYSGTLVNRDIANKTLRPKTYTTYYIDADGTRHYAEDATVLDGSNNELSAGWYVVKGNVEYSSKLSFGGDVNLILADGASLTVNSGDADAINVLGLLNIYGQAQGTGQLHASSTNSNGIYATGNITINGGSVEARAQNYSIFATGGNIILNGGSVEASSTNPYGIYAEGGSTILAGGSVKSNIYQGTVTVATDFTYAADKDDNTYSGTLDNSAIAGKTLRPKTYTTYYIDADGTRYDDVTATVLNGLNRELSAGWYVVKGNVNYNTWLYCTGDMRLILADDANLVVTESRMSAIIVDNGSLTIYGKAQGTGQLHASTESGDGINAYKGNITINGGRVGVSGVNCGISAENGNITINGGIVVASGMTNNGINATNGTILAGGSVMANSYGGTVTIATGLTYIDNDENTYTGTLDNEAIAGKRLSLKPYTVTFDINYEDGEDPEMQIVLSGRTATEPTAPIRTGYTLSGWKLNEEDYDFDTPVTGDITLTAVWTANNYTVEFNANGGSGDAMASMQLTYDGDWVTLPACTYTAPDGKAFKNWNTAADGSGTSYDDEGWVRNLTDEPNGTVVLYAQWGKDIAACTINVPGQTLDDYTAVSYKFEAANSGYASTGTTVYDGETLLTLGTDYRFGNVTMANGDPINWMGSKIGDECKVEIIGIGDYAGTIFKNFTVISPEANGEWGDLTWAIDADGDFTISKKDGVEGNVAMNETTKGKYPWYDKAGYIKTITIGDGITSVAANAFCREMEMNVYGNVHSLTLPESLTSIGEFAFAYCTALNINLTDLEGIDFPANAFSYINSLTGTLYDNADNTKTISVMAQVSKNDVTLTGRTLYKDGDWNTLCLPFDVSQGNSILDGATVKELDVDNYYDANGEFYTKLDYENAFRTGFDAETGTLYLYFKNVEADGSGVVLQAGTPYLIKWDKAEGYDAADPATRDITGDLVFWDAKLLSLPNNAISYDHNVTFCGNYSPVTLAAGDKSCLYLGAENKLYWPSVDRPINAFRAYFHVDLSNGAKVREIRLSLDDNVTSIHNTEFIIHNYNGGATYNLSGQKVSDDYKGIVIKNGRKYLK